MSDFKLTARLVANVSDFQRGMKQAESSLRTLKQQTGSSMERIGSSMQSVGKSLTTGVTLPLIGLGAASTKAFSSYETALVGVGKTTDITGEELKSLGKEFQHMAREIPVATNELLNIGESAGQLGIEKKNIMDFTETIAQISVATNMTSEQAANDFARLANITQMPQTEFDRLGSVVVELGNNMATTESEITAMGLRLAGTGAQVGLTEAQIMALAASMSSVGIEAQAGGSAFSRVMQKMNTEVLSGGDNLEKFASIAGLSAEEFAEKWQTNPPEAITDFVNGLGRVSETGGDVTATLQELGINSVNEIDTLSRLAGAGDLLTESFEMAGNAWEENTALSQEAEQAFSTFASSMQLLKNAFVEAGVAIGERLAPYIQQLAEYIMSAVNAFNDASPAIQTFVIVIGALAAAIGPVLLVIGTMLTLVPKLVLGFTMIKTAVLALGGAFGFLFAPITLVIVAIAALVAGIVYLWNTNEEFRAVIIDIWTAIKDFFLVTIPEIYNSIVEWFSQLPSRFIEWFNSIRETISTWAVETWNKAVEAGTNFVTAITEWFSQLPYKIGYFLGAAIGNVIVWAIEMWAKATETGSNFLNAIVQFFSQLPSRVWTFLTNAYSKTVTWGAQMISKGIDAGSRFIQAVIRFVQQLPGRVWTFLVQTISRLATWVGQMMQKGREAGSKLVSATVDAVKNLPSRMISFGKDVVRGFWNGIKSLGGWVRKQVSGFFKGVIDGAKSSLGINSPSKVFKQFGVWVDEGFGQGIDKGARKALKPMAHLMDNVQSYGEGLNLSVPSLVFDASELSSPSNLAIDTGVHQQVTHSLDGTQSNIMANINLRLGNNDYKAFVSDISTEQQLQTRLNRY